MRLPLNKKHPNCKLIISLYIVNSNPSYILNLLICAVEFISMALFYLRESLYSAISLKMVSLTFQKLHRKKSKSHISSPTVSRKTAVHRFSLPRYPGGVETVFSPKTNTFPDRRKEVRLWRCFALRKPVTTR